MQSPFKTKLLLHTYYKTLNAGFTLIELLVVIIIIGILAAIALPSFLGQANKARQAEAKAYIGTMNRAQQAYFLEKNTFASIVYLLGIGLTSNTAHYQYSTSPPPYTSFVTNKATSNQATLKSYLGVVVSSGLSSGEAAALTSLCNANDYSYWSGGTAVPNAAGTLTNYEPDCPAGFFQD